MVTRVQEEIPYCPLGLLQENRRTRVLQVNQLSGVKKPLRQLKQPIFC